MKLSDEERIVALGEVPDWDYDASASAIVRSFAFLDFGEAFSFMTRVAIAAEKADHHPDWSNSWNRVEISLSTHSEGGLTRRDIDLAKSIDSMAARLVLPETAH